MKRHPALALVELDDLPAGLHAVDAMAKRAPIACLRSGSVSRGRFLVLVGGTTAAVEEALLAALAAGAESVLDRLLLADVHPRLHDAIVGARRPAAAGAIALLETRTATAIVRAAEAALKATEVDLLELRLGTDGLAGKGTAILQGELPRIEAALAVALARLEETGAAARHRLIRAPHEALLAQIDSGTVFASQELLELEGERSG